MVADRDTFPLIAELLADQQRLDTPVARHAAAFEARAGTLPVPQLIPLTAPRPGERYAFEVDLDACTGCKSCVAACHALNGLDDEETWRDVGLLVSAAHDRPFAQTLTTACHHCEDPACLSGCPVLAYEQDPLTGIVRHLDDQCIGCSYCVLKCPYDVPKYSARRGIVRKCDMCHGRLEHGEAPACAQACPTHAIRIVTVARGAPHALPPACPDPTYTRPTTRYVSARQLPPTLIAGDAAALRPQPAHWPLVVLLTLMPLAVGAGVADALFAPATPMLARVGWAAGCGGLAASIAHLGQPWRAWRILLGLRRSWLSREALAFGVWLPLATGAAALTPIAGRHAWSIAAGAVGVVGLFCSAQIYADTRRPFWKRSETLPRFFGAAALLGLSAALATIAPAAAHPPLAGLLAGLALAKLAFEARALSPSGAPFDTDAAGGKTAALLRGPLRRAWQWRIACTFFGACVLPVAAVNSPSWPALASVGFALTFAGELLERTLFFRAVAAPKMPGMPL